MANNISIKDAAAATVVTKTTDNASVHTAHVNVDSGTITTVSTVTNLSQMGGVAISLNTGVRDTGTQRVTIATDDAIILGAGTAEIGKLAAGSAVIGEVTIGAATGAAGDLAKIVDAVAGASDVGVAGLHVVDAILTAITPVDGDYAPSRVDANGALWVHAVDGDAQVVLGTGTYTEGTSEGVVMGVVRKDTLTALANTDNEVAPLQVNATGALYAVATAGEAHVGEIGGNTVVKTITMTCATGALASGDVIADTQQMDAAFRVADGTGVLQSMTVFEPDDQAAFAFDV